MRCVDERLPSATSLCTSARDTSKPTDNSVVSLIGICRAKRTEVSITSAADRSTAVFWSAHAPSQSSVTPFRRSSTGSSSSCAASSRSLSWNRFRVDGSMVRTCTRSRTVSLTVSPQPVQSASSQTSRSLRFALTRNFPCAWYRVDTQLRQRRRMRGRPVGYTSHWVASRRPISLLVMVETDLLRHFRAETTLRGGGSAHDAGASGAPGVTTARGTRLVCAGCQCSRELSARESSALPECAAAGMVRRGHRRERYQLPAMAWRTRGALLGAVMSQLVYNGLSSFGVQDGPMRLGRADPAATLAARLRATPPNIGPSAGHRGRRAASV